MPEGECVICGAKFYGWSLVYRVSPCDECEGPVLLTKGEHQLERILMAAG